MTDIDLEVSAIHKRLAVAILSDGQEVPITTWLNVDGECDPAEATACVCGPDFDGDWYSIDLSKFKHGWTQ